MRSCNAASMPRARARQPDTARAAFTDHIARRQRASMQHATQPLCKALWRNPSRRATPFDSALYPSVAKSFRTVEHTHHSVTSIPGSTGRTLPALSFQGGWSLRLRRNACRPVILTQCVQLWDHSWYTCEHLRIATFTRACFHTPLHKRASTQASLQSRLAQSDRNGVPLEPSCALWLCWFHP